MTASSSRLQTPPTRLSRRKLFVTVAALAGYAIRDELRSGLSALRPDLLNEVAQNHVFFMCELPPANRVLVIRDETLMLRAVRCSILWSEYVFLSLFEGNAGEQRQNMHISS
jgi:hypothetical protein